MNHLKNTTNLRFIRNLHTTRNQLKSLAGASASKTEKKPDVGLVLAHPVVSKINFDLLPPRTVIDAKTIALLERLSLIDCVNNKEIRVLEDAIHFADQILQIDTKGVDPLFTVLEDRPLQIREDKVTEGNIRDAILSNASITEEEYLVSPPGNIPLDNSVKNTEQDTIKPKESTYGNVDSTPKSNN